MLSMLAVLAHPACRRNDSKCNNHGGIWHIGQTYNFALQMPPGPPPEVCINASSILAADKAWPVLSQAELVVLGGAFFVNGNVNPAGMCGPVSAASAFITLLH